MQVLAVFDDFSKGHYGDQPWRPNGYFGGENFIALPQGGLRIREGTGALDITGLPNSASFFMAPIRGGDAVVGIGTANWRITTGAPTSLTAFSSSVTAGAAGWCHYRDGSLITIRGDQTYRTGVFGTSALAGSPGGSHVAVLGDRIYVGSLSTALNRIRYSDAASETSWPAGNFVDIGTSDDVIVLMRSQRDSIVIATRSGSGGAQWWRLQGTPGINQTLTRIAPRTGYPLGGDHHNYNCDGYGSRIWFSSIGIDGYGGWYGYIDADTPRISNYPRPLNTTSTSQTTLGTNPYSVGSLTTADYTLLVAGTFSSSAVRSRSLLFQGATCVGQMVFDWPGTVDSNSQFSVVGSAGGTTFTLGNGGTAGAPPHFQSWGVVHALDIAPDETDGSGAAVTGEVHTPIFEAQPGQEMRIQAIEVDFRHYSASTTLTASVEMGGRYEAATGFVTSSITSTAKTASLGSPSPVGVKKRATFPVGDAGYGTWGQIKLTACRSIHIDQIRALGDTKPAAI